MIIVGIDASPKSSGLTKLVLDDDLKVIEKYRMGFKTVSKNSKESYKDIHTYSDKLSQYERFDFMLPKIFEFVEGADYVAYENYSFASGGLITLLSEFCGHIKFKTYQNGSKIRLYDPNTIKFLATGKGSADKTQMYDEYVKDQWKEEKIDISDLPIIPTFKKGKNEGKRDVNGVSPTSDIIDSWFICKILHLELQLRKGKITLNDLEEKHLTVFNRVTKAFPENILVREFLHKK